MSGVDIGTALKTALTFLAATPGQWRRIETQSLSRRWLARLVRLGHDEV